jgi:hypothetical protein
MNAVIHGPTGIYASDIRVPLASRGHQSTIRLRRYLGSRRVPSDRKSQGHPWRPSLTFQGPYFRTRTSMMMNLSSLQDLMSWNLGLSKPLTASQLLLPSFFKPITEQSPSKNRNPGCSFSQDVLHLEPTSLAYPTTCACARGVQAGQAICAGLVSPVTACCLRRKAMRGGRCERSNLIIGFLSGTRPCPARSHHAAPSSDLL